ncbi:hypothetical protein AALB53_08180 [Lachnospiraceae bacterium 47-T17]
MKNGVLMEVQTNRKMQLYIWVIRAFYIFVLLGNLIFSIYSDKLFQPGIFAVSIIMIWTYGLLCAHGFFRKVVSEEDENGQIRYETNIPYTPVSVVRIVELAYSFIGALETTNFKALLILIGLDVMFTVILLAYKSSYYYISELYVEEGEDVL